MNMANAQKSNKQTVEAKVVRRFDASSERVFDAWLNPETVRKWMTMPFEWGLWMYEGARVGGSFTFSDRREAEEAVHWGTYLEVDRPRKLVSHGSHRKKRKNKTIPL